MEPTAAVLALELPELPAKNMDDVTETMGSPAPEAPHDRDGPARDPACIHQLAGENEERHRHQRPGVQGREGSLRDDLEGYLPVHEQASRAAQTDAEGDRHAQSEQEDEADENGGNHRGVAPAAGLSRQISSTKSPAATIVIKSPLVGTAR